MSLTIKRLIFNAFQVNTYMVFHENGECIVIDPACYTPSEQEELSGFISDKQLVVKYCINTHSHIDHILGNGYIFKSYGVRPMIHQLGMLFYDHIVTHANTFGFEIDQVIHPEAFLDDGQDIMLGESLLKVVYTPGHAEGSICLISEEKRWIITGDLLFRASIGRTDLPSGNLEKLLSSIRRKIFLYDDDFIIYPGHGEATTIGYERKNNPYL